MGIEPAWTCSGSRTWPKTWWCRSWTSRSASTATRSRSAMPGCMAPSCCSPSAREEIRRAGARHPGRDGPAPHGRWPGGHDRGHRHEPRQGEDAGRLEPGGLPTGRDARREPAHPAVSPTGLTVAGSTRVADGSETLKPQPGPVICAKEHDEENVTNMNRLHRDSCGMSVAEALAVNY